MPNVVPAYGLSSGPVCKLCRASWTAGQLLFHCCCKPMHQQFTSLGLADDADILVYTEHSKWNDARCVVCKDSVKDSFHCSVGAATCFIPASNPTAALPVTFCPAVATNTRLTSLSTYEICFSSSLSAKRKICIFSSNQMYTAQHNSVKIPCATSVISTRAPLTLFWCL